MYFCPMIQRLVLVFLLFSTFFCYSQIRLTKLVLEPNQKYRIENTDILVVDTLIMNDSSSIFLNLSKQDNFIHAKETIIGRGCSIIGHGKSGDRGKDGEPGSTQSVPCRGGAAGASA